MTGKYNKINSQNKLLISLLTDLQSQLRTLHSLVCSSQKPGYYLYIPSSSDFMLGPTGSTYKLDLRSILSPTALDQTAVMVHPDYYNTFLLPSHFVWLLSLLQPKSLFALATTNYNIELLNPLMVFIIAS